MSDYVPKPDIEGINSPEKTTPVKDLSVLVAGFLGVVFAFYFLFSSVTDWALTRVSLQTEMRYLGGLWTSIDNGLAKDQRPRDFDDFVGLINAHVYFPLRVSVVCQKEANAFALPGGGIYLTSGLLEKVKSENGLAFVLGHEVGHFINRDHIRGVGRQIVFAFGAAMFGFSDMGGASALSGMISHAFDRGQETAADEYALGLMQKVYGHTWGADEFFSALAKDETVVDKTVTRFLSTHPLSSERVNRIRASQTGEPQPLKTPARPFAQWSGDFGCP